MFVFVGEGSGSKHLVSGQHALLNPNNVLYFIIISIITWNLELLINHSWEQNYISAQIEHQNVSLKTMHHEYSTNPTISTICCLCHSGSFWFLRYLLKYIYIMCYTHIKSMIWQPCLCCHWCNIHQFLVSVPNRVYNVAWLLAVNILCRQGL